MVADSDGGRRKRYVYDLDDPQSVREFSNEANPDHVIGIASWLEEHVGVMLPITCDECGHSFDVLDIEADGIVHHGGIRYSSERKICEDCKEQGTCDGCRDYEGESNLTETEDGRLCDVCLPDLTNGAEIAQA